MRENEITLLLAIYGAILSTIAIFWNIWRDIKNRAEISVSAQLSHDWLISGFEFPCISTELANIGKRPTTITKLLYKIGGQVFFAELIGTQGLPKGLEEGEIYTVNISKEKLVNSGDVIYFYAKDARGKRYRSKKYPLRGQ